MRTVSIAIDPVLAGYADAQVESDHAGFCFPQNWIPLGAARHYRFVWLTNGRSQRVKATAIAGGAIGRGDQMRLKETSEREHVRPPRGW